MIHVQLWIARTKLSRLVAYVILTSIWLIMLWTYIYAHYADSFVWSSDPCNVFTLFVVSTFSVLSFLLASFLPFKIKIQERERERETERVCLLLARKPVAPVIKMTLFSRKSTMLPNSIIIQQLDNDQYRLRPRQNFRLSAVCKNRDSWICSIFLVLQISVCACIYNLYLCRWSLFRWYKNYK